jgi:hypothetical protein
MVASCFSGLDHDLFSGSCGHTLQFSKEATGNGKSGAESSIIIHHLLTTVNAASKVKITTKTYKNARYIPQDSLHLS